MKYVIVKVNPPNLQTTFLPIVFGDLLIHSEVFEMVRSNLCKNLKCHQVWITVEGAGFVDRDKKVYGRSVSLKIESKLTDELYL